MPQAKQLITGGQISSMVIISVIENEKLKIALDHISVFGT